MTNQFCLRVSRYCKFWKAEGNNNQKKEKKKRKNSYYRQTTQHYYRKLKILSKLIVSPRMHTFPWRMWNQGVSLVSLLISGIRILISVLKLGPCPEGHSKALVVSMGAVCLLVQCPLMGTDLGHPCACSEIHAWLHGLICLLSRDCVNDGMLTYSDKCIVQFVLFLFIKALCCHHAFQIKWINEWDVSCKHSRWFFCKRVPGS